MKLTSQQNLFGKVRRYDITWIKRSSKTVSQIMAMHESEPNGYANVTWRLTHFGSGDIRHVRGPVERQSDRWVGNREKRLLGKWEV